jgi:GNAT superfamily N-acetyltransferase
MNSAPTTKLVLAFARTWDLRQTMAFEAVYHPNLRLSLAEKIEQLVGAECVWLYDARTQELIGETYGVPVRAALFDEDEDGDADVRPYRNRRALYTFSTTILPAFQRQSLGRILKAFFLGIASEAGYSLVLGHAREGGSVRLNETFGAQIGTAHPDWCGTGETYYFYALQLRPRERPGAPSGRPRRLRPR